MLILFYQIHRRRHEYLTGVICRELDCNERVLSLHGREIDEREHRVADYEHNRSDCGYNKCQRVREIEHIARDAGAKRNDKEIEHAENIHLAVELHLDRFHDNGDYRGYYKRRYVRDYREGRLRFVKRRKIEEMPYQKRESAERDELVLVFRRDLFYAEQNVAAEPEQQSERHEAEIERVD